MNDSTLRVSKKTREKLEKLKANFNYTSYDILLDSLADFIYKKNINIRDDFSGDFRNEINCLGEKLVAIFTQNTQDLKKDNKSLRNWVGGITKDHLEPLTEKLSILDKLNDYLINENNVKLLNNSNEDNFLNTNLEKKNIGKEKYKESDLGNDKFKEIYAKYEVQKQILFQIFNNYKIESGGMLGGGKIVINLSVKEWENLKQNS